MYQYTTANNNARIKTRIQYDEKKYYRVLKNFTVSQLNEYARQYLISIRKQLHPNSYCMEGNTTTVF